MALLQTHIDSTVRDVRFYSGPRGNMRCCKGWLACAFVRLRRPKTPLRVTKVGSNTILEPNLCKIQITNYNFTNTLFEQVFYPPVLFHILFWHRICFSFSVFHSHHMYPLRKLKEKNMPPVINQELCTGCGTCADICPMNVFEQDAPKTEPRVAYGEECWHCNACVLDCPKKAVSLRIPLNYMLLHVDASQFKE